jgi:hypothetical protein
VDVCDAMNKPPQKLMEQWFANSYVNGFQRLHSNDKFKAGFEVSTVLMLEIQVLWDVVLHRW